MRRLSYKHNRTYVKQRTYVEFRHGGAGFWLCNSFDDVAAAIGTGHPFIAHEVRREHAHAVVINPAAVAVVKKLDETEDQ